jgi:multiple sugar transport system substrate-binding protein
MNRIKRLLAIGLTSIFLVSGLVGCNSAVDKQNNSEQTTVANEQSQQATEKKTPVEIAFWAMDNGEMFTEVMKGLVENFSKIEPGVKVNYQTIAWDGWYEKFMTAIASNTAPDMSTGSAYLPFQLAKVGQILPIDDVIEKMKSTGKINDYPLSAIEAMKYNGNYVGLPWALDVRMIYYQKDNFAQAGITQLPKNWEEFKAAGAALKKNGKYLLTTAGDNMDTVMCFLLMNGGGLFDEQGKPDVTNSKNEEALKFYQELVNAGYINKAALGFKGGDAFKEFTTAEASTMFVGPGLEVFIEDLKGKVDVMPPLISPSGDKGTMYWVNSIMLYKQSKNPEAAKAFLEWLSDNFIELWTKGKCGSGVPANIKVAKDPYFEDLSYAAFNKYYTDVIKTTGWRSTTVFPELNEVEGDGFIGRMNQRVLNGDDVKEILAEGQKKLEELMVKK